MRLFVFPLVVLSVSLCSLSLRAQDAPERSPEWQALAHFIGTWDIEGTAKPSGQGVSEFESVEKRTWSQGGKFLRFEATGQPETHILMTFDPTTRTYPGVMMSGSRQGILTGRWYPDERTMHFTVEYPDKSTYRGSHRFVRDDYAE